MTIVQARSESKDAAQRAIESAAPALIELSHDIHSHPELCFEEHQAAGWAASALERAGFDVVRGVAGLDTAFEATAGSGELVIAYCAEYDALPGIGHACGHNLICASSVGAGIGLAAAADQLGVTVKVIGTPAEEGGGGKVMLLEAGVFEDVHAALMSHPTPGGADLVDWAPIVLACVPLEVEYRGRSAHAAGNPQDGINAADAAVLAQTAIGLLRQHLAPGDLVHGIVRHGGDAPNVIPERTLLDYIVRSPSIDTLTALEARVRRCFEAGAIATGCTVEVRHTAPIYSHIESDRDLTRCYVENIRALGREPIDLPLGRRVAASSTDMANITLALPAIHPGFGVTGALVPPHHPDFAAACATPDADDSMLFAATALAWTGIDIASDADVRDRLLRRERSI